MKLAHRAAALLLSAALLLPASAMAAEPLSHDARQQDLDFLYTTLAQRHPDLFAHQPEETFLAKKAEIERRLDALSDLEFTFELQSLVALAQDSHTTTSLASPDAMRLFPFSLVCYDGDWILSVVEKDSADGLGKSVAALNGYSMDEVLQRFSSFVSADNGVKLRRQTRQLIYAEDILAYLGLAVPGEPLTLTLSDGSEITLTALPSELFSQAEFSYLADQRAGKPVTSYDKKQYYFSLPLDESTYYIQYNRCQEDPERPMEDFTAQVESDLAAGRYTQVLIDLRNNGGGSDGVLIPLLNLLAPMVRSGAVRLYGLIGETTFSSAVINAAMIREAGGFLAGSETSGSADHFGSTRSFQLPNSGMRVSCSTKYIELGTLLETAQSDEETPLRPDFPVEQTLEDYLAGRDTLVDTLLAQGGALEPPNRDSMILTRAYFTYLLWERARDAGKDVSAPEGPFSDVLPFAYYAPASDWAAANGIVTGGGDGLFSPARLLTCSEAAVMLDRFAAYMGTRSETRTRTQPFTDEAEIPAWALEAAYRAGFAADQDAFWPDQVFPRGSAPLN